MGSRGPEPLPESQRRVHRLGWYVSRDELEQLERQLGLAGLASLVVDGDTDRRRGDRRVQQMLREALLGHRAPRPVPSINIQAAAGLGRVGGNLNQLLAAIHGGRVRVDGAAVIAEVQALREQLQAALLGLAEAAPAPAASRRRAAASVLDVPDADPLAVTF